MAVIFFNTLEQGGELEHGVLMIICCVNQTIFVTIVFIIDKYKTYDAQDYN